MKTPSLQKTAAASALLHVSFFLLSALLLKHSADTSLPSPYIVSLVGPARDSRDTSDKTSAEDAETAAVENKSIQTIKDNKYDQKLIEDRISELKAKNKIKDIVTLRSKLLSIKGSQDKSPVKTQPGKGQGGSQPGSGKPGPDSYENKIRGEIWKEWDFPDTPDKALEAIISIKIMKDGTLTDLKKEKSSGNLLFDRSALRAIVKASPVTPPPFEMEIGIRFTP